MWIGWERGDPGRVAGGTLALPNFRASIPLVAPVGQKTRQQTGIGTVAARGLDVTVSIAAIDLTLHQQMINETMRRRPIRLVLMQAGMQVFVAQQFPQVFFLHRSP